MLQVTTQSKEWRNKMSMPQGNTYEQVRLKDYNNSKTIINILTTSSIVFVTCIFTLHQLTRISTPITWLTFTLSKSSFPSNRNSPSSKAMKGRHITQLKFKWYSSSASVAYNKGRITWLRQITYKINEVWLTGLRLSSNSLFGSQLKDWERWPRFPNVG